MPPRVRITQKRAQPVQDPEEDGDEEEDEEEVGVEFPANLRQRVLVCCNLGQHKSTKYALAICKDCKCCWHVECIKPSRWGGALLAADKKVLKAKKKGDMSGTLSGIFVKLCLPSLLLARKKV